MRTRDNIRNLAMIRLFYCLAAVLLARSALVEQSVGQNSSGPEIGVVESQTVVFKDSHSDPYDRGNYFGFNHAPSVTVLGGERVMSVWFSGPFEGSVDQVILGAVSEDGGKTWDPARTITDEPRVSDFDPGFIHAGNRTLLFFSNGRWANLPSPRPKKGERPQIGVDSFHMLLMTSDDQGKTWSDPREVGSGPGWNCRSNGIKLRNGTLLIPTHHLKFPHISSVLLSSDNGRTWTRGPNITTPNGVGAAEPSVAELPDGKLVMVLRTTDGHLWLASSQDQGRTWLPPERLSLPAAESSANLICTSTGKLVLTHNPTKPPLRTELTIRIASDGGKSWSRPLTLDKVKPKAGATNGTSTRSEQVCYPSVCELSDGTLLVVWARIALGAEEESGAIHSARVRLN